MHVSVGHFQAAESLSFSDDLSGILRPSLWVANPNLQIAHPETQFEGQRFLATLRSSAKTWNTRSLADEPIAWLILDGTVVRVRLENQCRSKLAPSPEHALGAQQLGEFSDGLDGHVDLEAQLFGNFGRRTLDPERP